MVTLLVFETNVESLSLNIDPGAAQTSIELTVIITISPSLIF